MGRGPRETGITKRPSVEIDHEGRDGREGGNVERFNGEPTPGLEGQRPKTRVMKIAGNGISDGNGGTAFDMIKVVSKSREFKK